MSGLLAIVLLLSAGFGTWVLFHFVVAGVNSDDAPVALLRRSLHQALGREPYKERK